MEKGRPGSWLDMLNMTMMLTRFPFSRWTWVSRYQNVTILDFVGAKDEGVSGDTGAVSCAKLRSNRRHQQTNAQLYTGRMPFLSPNQQRQMLIASTAL